MKLVGGNSPQDEAQRGALFARVRTESPLPIRQEIAPLPGGFALAADEFLVGTAKDWGLGGMKLALTTQRLICPSEPDGKEGVSVNLKDILEVTYRKHFVGFSTLSVATSGGERHNFPAHANGQKLREAIFKMVQYARRNPNPPARNVMPTSTDKYDQLRKIADLRAAGILSEAEFEREKARLLDEP
jgi:hypothetical protein